MKQLMLCHAFLCGTVFSLAVVATADEKSLDDILRDGNNAFTAKMFTEAVRDTPKQSVVLSAFSVLTPLAQLALASVGKSHDELLASIGMPNDNITMAVFSKLKTHSRSVKGVTLKAASRIYVANKYEINSDVANLYRDVFGSEVAYVNFTEDEKAAQEVNLWVEKQTDKRIRDLVDPFSLGRFITAVIANAIYFKGLWEIPFNKLLTTNNKFHVNKANLIEVPTMYNVENYKYIDSQELNAQVLELKYKGGEMALYVVLPREVDGITELEEKLRDPSLLDDVIKSMRETRLEVNLPKFKIETTTDLRRILKNTNGKRLFPLNVSRLDKLFKNVNNFSHIIIATQKAFIEVNDEGAEATFENAFKTMDARRDERGLPEFTANRPFYFIVKEKSLTLLNGKYVGY